MKASLVQINPASGDDHAAIFSESGTVLGTLEKGTILKVISDNGGTMTVSYEDPDVENIPLGGGGSSGVIAATPHTFLYTDNKKRHVVSMINNGTPIQIIDDDLEAMFKVRGTTVDGEQEGWVDYKYVFRASLKAEE